MQMKFELINPSDKILFTADSLETAAISVFTVGNGSYGAEQVDGGVEVPMFLFGGADEWVLETFGVHMFGFVDKFFYRKETADCLRSFSVDGERTSINDICKFAHNMADRIEKHLNDQSKG